MKLNLLLPACFFLLIANAQPVKITAIEHSFSNSYSNHGKLSFPVIHSDNPAISKKINKELFGVFLEPSSKILIDVMKTQVELGLVDMSYKVILNNGRILTLGIYMEGCGAYCTNSTYYFNFETKTGNKLVFPELLNLDGNQLISKIQEDKNTALKKYLLEEGEILKKYPEIDIDFKTISSLTDPCFNIISFDNYYFTATSIEINDDCDFPHFIRSQQPVYDLSYPYSTLMQFVKPKYMYLFK